MAKRKRKVQAAEGEVVEQTEAGDALPGYSAQAAVAQWRQDRANLARVRNHMRWLRTRSTVGPNELREFIARVEQAVAEDQW